MLNNNRIGELHFWCQKVLPLVYDNSLSYYEALLKFKNKLNEVVNYTNEIPEYIDEKVKEAFDDEHLKELISEVFKTIEDAISANNEGTNTHFSQNYPNVGTLVWHDNKLYRTIHAIDEGDTIIPNSNIELVNFGDMFSEFLTEVKTRFTDNDDGLRETSSTDRPVHDLVWLNDELYEVIKPIAEGNAYIYTGTNKNVESINLDKIYDYLLDLISSEIATREHDDGVLQDNIDAEALARENADGALQDNIGAEALARENADSTLQDNIDAEALARENADGTLQGNIDAEALARGNADDELRRLIESGVSYYGNITEFKSDTSVQPNKHYLVTGYYTSGDCEIMIYETTGTATGAYREIVLDNGVCAHLVKSNNAYFNVKQYGAYGDGLHNDYTILNDIINHARTLENAVVYLPQGEYIINMYLDALKTSSITNDPRDFHGMTLCGDGISTVIHGKSETDKFDILQLNEVCNLNIKNLALTETSSAEVTWGVNGISLTNGCYNVTIEGVHVFDIDGYVDGYINGGKAFTIQTGDANTVNVHDIFIRNCSCKNVPLGFEFDAPANSVQFRNIRVENCMFDVLHDGIVLSMPSWGSGLYASTTDFHFVCVTVRSRQHCVNLSRGSQVYFDHCSFIQYDTPLYYIDSDRTLDSFKTYASRLIYLSNSVFVSSFGTNAIHLQTDGTTPSKFIIIKNVTVFFSFTGAGIESNSYSNDCYIDNFQNMGATNTITSIARACANTYLNNGGYQIMNNYLMTKTSSAKTLGTYTGNAIPVYNENGSPIGWVPLYN